MSREMIHKHQPVLSKKYFDSENASAIFGAALRAISQRYNYRIGQKGEHDLLINLMDYVYHKVYKVNPSMTLLQLNQHTIKMYVSMIEDKLTENRRLPQPDDLMYDRGQQLTQADSQDDFRNRMMQMSQERSNVPVHPRPTKQVRPNEQDLNKAFEEQLNLRKPKEAVRDIPNFKVEQPNLAPVDNAYEQEMQQRQHQIVNFQPPPEKVDINEIYTNHLHKQPTETYDAAFNHYEEPRYVHAQPINSVNERIKQIQENQHENAQDGDIETVNASVLQSYPEPMQKARDEHENRLMEDHILVIDSRDRNYDDHPNSNTYRFSFERPYDNVVSVSLLSAEVPKSQYLINSSNNKIYFQELNSQVSGGTYLETTVAIGDYTLSELKTAIETAMNAVGTASYTVDIATLAAQSKVAISSDLSGVDLFNLSFNGGTETFGNKTRTVYRDNSIGPVIGYSRTDYTGASSYNGDQRVNLNGDSYILLRFRDLPYMDAGLGSDGIQDAFAKIPLNVHSDNVKYHKEGDYQLIRTFEQLLTRMDHLDVSFVNYDGSLYDFNGLENSITLKITTLRYNNNS
jgi:hypothetical protein